MISERTQLKFATSERTGEIIGFVSRHSKTKQLRGVREDSPYKKKICVLSEDLKGKVQPNILYSVELKAMHSRNGFVVVAATPLLFKATIDTLVIPGGTYRVTVNFGNKTVYFDPLGGNSYSSKTVSGVVSLLQRRTDIENLEGVINRCRKTSAENGRRRIQHTDHSRFVMRPKRGIATDGAHSMKRGVTRYRAVNLATGELLFEQNIGNQTINIGEFLGVVEAAKYIIEHRFSPAIIYTDSLTALTWFNEKRTASRKRNAALKKAEIFLKAMASEIDKIEVLHWNNSLWGETPADFGEK